MGQLGRVLGASKYRPFSYRILKDFFGTVLLQPRNSSFMGVG